MAAHSVLRSKTATLGGTTVDTVTLTQPWDRVEVTNQSTDTALYARFDGTAPTSAGDNCTYVGPGQSVVVPAVQLNSALGGSNWHQVGVIGNGNVFTVEGLAGQ
jgi:hypothetical protein